MSSVCLILAPLSAQEQNFSFGLGAGVSSLTAKPVAPVKTAPAFGFKVNLGYDYFFTPHWGVGTGLGLGHYASSLKANGAQSLRTDVADSYGEKFDLRSTLGKYSERQKALMLEIPIMLRYQAPLNPHEEGHGLGFALGLKVAVPLSARYHVDAFTIDNEGDYHYGKPVTSPNFQGLGTFNRPAQSGKLGMKPSAALAAEICYHLPLNLPPFGGTEGGIGGTGGLEFGLYCDYGLNNVRSGSPAPLVEPNAVSSDKFAVGSVVNAVNEARKPFVGKIRPFSAGVIVRITFGKKSQPTNTASPRNLEQEVTSTSSVTTVPAEPAEAPPAAPAEAPASIKAPEPASASAPEPTPAPAPAPAPDSLNSTHYTLQTPHSTLFHPSAADSVHIADLSGAISGFSVAGVAIPEGGSKELDRKVELLKRFPDAEIQIAGYTDDSGTPEFNLDLSRRRAMMAKDYLVRHGIAEYRITTQGFGQSMPIAPNTTNDNRMKNRRLEFKITNLER